MSKFQEYLEAVKIRKNTDYWKLIKKIIVDVNKKFKVSIDEEYFDLKDLELRWNYKSGVNYQTIVSKITDYTYEELLDTVIKFLKRKGKIK